MDITRIAVGAAPPEDINVIVEVPAGDPVKYEMDKDSGALFVDRLIATPMRYPAHYGFVPHTLSEDGDPVDVLVACDVPLQPGCVIRARPIGVLVMEDESGGDEKILAVPHAKMTPLYSHVREAADLPAHFLAQIRHFFEHYKDLESGKWVKVRDWAPAATAREMIGAAIRRAAGA